METHPLMHPPKSITTFPACLSTSPPPPSFITQQHLDLYFAVYGNFQDSRGESVQGNKYEELLPVVETMYDSN